MNRNELKATNARLDVADWISFAAAPVFAIMAVLTNVFGGAPADMLCLAAHGASPLNGMAPMYLLMCAVHLAPWLKLISRGRNYVRQSPQIGLCHWR